MTQSIHWHWYGRNRHAITFFDVTEFMFALPISKKKAEQLIELGMDHGS